MQPKRLGNCGWYLRVLKCASENGLSFEVCGLLCDLVTPRSASRKAVALAFMGPPRSACNVSWSGATPYLTKASSNKALNRSVSHHHWHRGEPPMRQADVTPQSHSRDERFAGFCFVAKVLWTTVAIFLRAVTDR